MKKPLRNSMIFFVSVVFMMTAAIPPVFAQSKDIVASLQRISGRVSVKQVRTRKTIRGRNGLLLRTGDTVITARRARSTIKFRNGSEIRLFPRSEFQVRTSERKGKRRTFRFSLFSRVGSFWGRFVKRRQVANIRTPTATIGIKGTVLRVVDRDGKARVALTEGLIDVSNDREKVELRPGKRLTEFASSDTLADKIQDIPLQLDMKSQKRKLEFRNSQPEEVFVSIQLVNIKTGRPIRRSGSLYLRSNYDKITYPREAVLDERGFARVRIQFAPPEPSDAKLNGNVFLWAVMDQEDADDVSEGRLKFTIPVPPGADRFRIPSDTGEVKREK
ncbi:MAG: FecR family protein [bacterium]